MKVLVFLAALIAAPMEDPAQEARARALENEIRCVVCENEPISQSTADIAGDMRKLIRERIAAGDSDEQIRAFFRDRYGEFVLLRPGGDPSLWLLWGAPILLLAAAAGTAALLRRGEAAPAAPEESER